MVWVMIGDECVDTVCRCSRESVRKTVEAGPRVYEVHQPSIHVRFCCAVGRKERITRTMRVSVSRAGRTTCPMNY